MADYLNSLAALRAEEARLEQELDTLAGKRKALHENLERMKHHASVALTTEAMEFLKTGPEVTPCLASGVEYAPAFEAIKDSLYDLGHDETFAVVRHLSTAHPGLTYKEVDPGASDFNTVVEVTTYFRASDLRAEP